jgi:hypothetical protein
MIESNNQIPVCSFIYLVVKRGFGVGIRYLLIMIFILSNFAIVMCKPPPLSCVKLPVVSKDHEFIYFYFIEKNIFKFIK